MLNAKIKIFKKFRKEIEENIHVILEWVENSFKQDSGASLVVQWLRIQLAYSFFCCAKAFKFH